MGFDLETNGPLRQNDLAAEAVDVPAATVLPNGPGRDARTGRFTLGATASVAHGLFSPRDLAQLGDEVARFLAGSLTDDGGEANIGTRRRALVEYRARLHRRIIQLDNAIEAKSLIDKRGRLRVAWLQMLATLIDKARALDALLGLERQPRRLNVAEQFAQIHTGKRRPR